MEYEATFLRGSSMYYLNQKAVFCPFTLSFSLPKPKKILNQRGVKFGAYMLKNKEQILGGCSSGKVFWEFGGEESERLCDNMECEKKKNSQHLMMYESGGWI